MTDRDFEPIKELERRTKAGVVAPLVMPRRECGWKRFLWEFLLGRAIRAWKGQLELRARGNAAGSLERTEELQDLIRILAVSRDNKTKSLICQIMPEDSLDAVLCVSRHWDGPLDFEVFYGIEETYGKLTDEEVDAIDRDYRNWTVGDLVTFMNRLKSEGREKPVKEPPRRSVCAIILYAVVFAAGAAWLGLIAWGFVRDLLCTLVSVLSLVCSVLSLACLIYVPICAIVALARSLADPGDGKMARGEEWVGKLFSWRCLLWAVYALFILFCISSADCHPVHDGMTEAESKILCWKALLSGPYAGQLLPCVPERVSRFSAAYVVIPMLFLLSAAVLAAFRKWRLALYGLAVFVLFWFMLASGYLWYWK